MSGGRTAASEPMGYPTEAASDRPGQPRDEPRDEPESAATSQTVEQPGPEPATDAVRPSTQEPEPEPEPVAPPRVPSTVADLLAQASSAERADELLRTYWEDYAANHENRALDAFNSKPKKGIELAMADGLCVEEARSIAMFLLRAPGLDKTQIGEYLGNPAELNVATLREYVQAIGMPTFPRLGFDDALRMFLQGFRLPGEAAPIERCMEAFSDTFNSAQPGLFDKEDTAFLLAYSTIMLNTDLHNDAQKNKMSKQAFVERTKSTAADPKLTAAYLGTIYDRILTNEIQMNDAGGNTIDLTSVWTYSKPRIQGYLTKKGHKMIRTNNDYWAVLKGGALMLLDKPPALNAKPMLCLKIVLGYSISVAQKGKSFEILAPEGEAIIATRFNERNEESEDVEIREYNKYTFEAESAEVAAQWTEALLDEFGEQDDGRHDSDGSGGGAEGDECDNRDGPTEQADDLRQDEMEDMIAESRLIIASECLAAAEYENARLAYSAVLQLSPNGPRAKEAKRGFDEATKGIKLERAAVDIAPIVDSYRQSMADESADEAAADAVLEVQQAISSVLGVEPLSPRERLYYLCVRKAGVTESLDYDAENPRMVAYYMKGEVVDVVDVQTSASGKIRFLTSKGWCSKVSESGVTLFEEICVGKEAVNADPSSSHGEVVKAMAAQIKALTEENKRLKLQLEHWQSMNVAST